MSKLPMALTNLPMVMEQGDLETVKKNCSHNHLHNWLADADSDAEVAEEIQIAIP